MVIEDLRQRLPEQDLAVKRVLFDNPLCEDEEIQQAARKLLNMSKIHDGSSTLAPAPAPSSSASNIPTSPGIDNEAGDGPSFPRANRVESSSFDDDLAADQSMFVSPAPTPTYSHADSLDRLFDDDQDDILEQEEKKEDFIRPRISEAGKKRLRHSSEDSTEEIWTATIKKKPRNSTNHTKRKSIDQKIDIKDNVKRHASAARKRFARTSTSEKDDRVALAIFREWDKRERKENANVQLPDPVAIYRQLQQSLTADDGENTDANYTASQSTMMILSLGSAEAVAGLKFILQKMRDPSQAIMVLPPARNNAMENLVQLASLFPDGEPKGNQFEVIRFRYYITRFCSYVASERNRWMRLDSELSAEDAINETYAEIIMLLYPTLEHFKESKMDGRLIQNPNFTKRVNELEEKTYLGFRWLPLQQRYGVGILALYQHQNIFGGKAIILIDDPIVSDDEIQLLHDNLSQAGNPHSEWLTRLCNMLNGLIENGLKGTLTSNQLLVELWDKKEIKAFKEHSDKLAMMCMTRTDYDGVRSNRDQGCQTSEES